MNHALWGDMPERSGDGILRLTLGLDALRTRYPDCAPIIESVYVPDPSRITVPQAEAILQRLEDRFRERTRGPHPREVEETVRRLLPGKSESRRSSRRPAPAPPARPPAGDASDPQNALLERYVRVVQRERRLRRYTRLARRFMLALAPALLIYGLWTIAIILAWLHVLRTADLYLKGVPR